MLMTKKLLRYIPIFLLVILLTSSIITGVRAAESVSNSINGTVTVVASESLGGGG